MSSIYDDYKSDDLIVCPHGWIQQGCPICETETLKKRIERLVGFVELFGKYRIDLISHGRHNVKLFEKLCNLQAELTEGDTMNTVDGGNKE